MLTHFIQFGHHLCYRGQILDTLPSGLFLHTNSGLALSASEMATQIRSGSGHELFSDVHRSVDVASWQFRWPPASLHHGGVPSQGGNSGKGTMSQIALRLNQLNLENQHLSQLAK